MVNMSPLCRFYRDNVTRLHVLCIRGIDISQCRLLFGFFLLYKGLVPFELLDSAASYEGRAAVEGGK
jgi:hypothetical protein